MSQSNTNTHVSVSSPPSQDHQSMETTDKNDIKSNDPVIPWVNEPHSVSIKSFAGYDIKFNGWVRKDIKEQRQVAQEEEEQIEI